MSVANLGTPRGQTRGFEIDLETAVEEDRPFTAGTAADNAEFPLSGYPTPGGYHGPLGLLGKEWAAMAGEADWVIFSYKTVVAFRSAGVWSVPDVHHSATTSNYVARVRGAFRVTRAKAGT